MRRFRHIHMAAIAASVAAATFWIPSIGRGQGNQAAPALVDAKSLLNIGKSADKLQGTWLTYGGTQSETRYSPLKQIDTSNVKRLGLAFTQPVGSGGGNQEGTLLVWNNTIYGITTGSVVFAADARTGERIWKWDPEVNLAALRPRLCCMVNRGIALYGRIIIAPSIDGRLFGLDALTGKPIWETRVAYPQDNYLLTIAPRIAGDKVIIGNAGGDRGTRGFFDAYDAATGRFAWRFYTVPGDPSKPFEQEAMRTAAKTWGGDWYKNGGGGAVWDSIAYDPEANLVYVGTGNAEPWPQKFRGAQNLDNLYTCSILAVDLKTGLLKWHFQTVPNDNWDYDSDQQLMLLDLTINGRVRKVITQAPKSGFFYVLDRVTGEFISGAPYVKVTWALGLDKNGRAQVNPEAFYDQDAVTVFPGGGGAHNWAPMSYNPAAGLVYIPVSYGSFSYQAAEEYVPRTFGTVRPASKPREIGPAIGPESPKGVNGGLQAWDPVNQKLAWRADGGGGAGGGTLATAGNLVFYLTGGGLLRAFSADKGEKLLEIQTGRNGMGPPITYEASGKQYIAFIGGGAGGSAQNGQNPDPPLLFTFTLDGRAEMPEPVQSRGR